MCARLFQPALQVGVATRQVVHAGSEAQRAEAAKVLTETRRALYRILAEDDTDQLSTSADGRPAAPVSDTLRAVRRPRPAARPRRSRAGAERRPLAGDARRAERYPRRCACATTAPSCRDRRDGLGGQIVAVAVGWQVYAIHRSAFDLGLIGARPSSLPNSRSRFPPAISPTGSHGGAVAVAPRRCGVATDC